MSKKIVLIAGPTASGKSKIAIEIAKKIKGEIINADSMQVYKEFSILSSRPSNLDLKKIHNSKYFLKAISGRGSIHTVKRYNKEFKLIDESYNANPLSVKNAICNLSNIKKNNSKKYLLLGDMLELGNKSDYYHKNLSKVINNTDIDKVFVYGDKILNTYRYTKKNKQGNILQHHSYFDYIFSDLIKNNDYLMIKASNATGLNKLSNKIIKGIRNVI